MTTRPLPHHIGIAEAKRRFADLIGTVRYRGERFVIGRRGTPMAALVPLEDLERLTGGQSGGFLALVGKFEDAPDFPDELDRALLDRSTQRSRPAPKLGR